MFKRSAPQLNVYSNYAERVPSKWALVVETGSFSVMARSSSYGCSAHTFPLDLTASFPPSVAATFENVAQEIEMLDQPIAEEALARQGYAGLIRVRGESLRTQLNFISGFFSSTAEATVYIEVGLLVDGSDGPILGTLTAGVGRADGNAGVACEGGAPVLAEASANAVRAVLGQIAERFANTPRIREVARERALGGARHLEPRPSGNRWTRSAGAPLCPMQSAPDCAPAAGGGKWPAMSQNWSFQCPPSMRPHVQSVLAGEYDIAYDNPKPVILDIGANIGSFALWASRRWPGSVIHCYEPLPENFAALEANVAPVKSRVTLSNHAIGEPGERKLFLGRNNCGEASFFDLGEQSRDWVNVEARAPATLPKADILKLDTEGAEVEILSGLQDRAFDLVLLEYHSEENRRAVDRLLQDYILVGGRVRGAHRGVLKYVRRPLFDALAAR